MEYYTASREGLNIRDMDIRHTLESAQPLTFHADYDFSNGSVCYASESRIVRFSFMENASRCKVRFGPCNLAFARKDLIKRFRLKDDMDSIYAHIATDEFMASAVRKYKGMRITLNDPWETTLCFIISQYNNVKRIRLIVKRLISEFGNDITDGNGAAMKGFPSAADLAAFGDRDFRRCGAGFRAKYIAQAADCCANNMDLNSLAGKGYEKIKSALMEISGVGDKVADCIALMGYGKMEAFPIDVWVKRTLENVYFNGKAKSIKELHRFVEDRWEGKYRGHAQQYIFWAGRSI